MASQIALPRYQLRPPVLTVVSMASQSVRQSLLRREKPPLPVQTVELTVNQSVHKLPRRPQPPPLVLSAVLRASLSAVPPRLRQLPLVLPATLLPPPLSLENQLPHPLLRIARKILTPRGVLLPPLPPLPDKPILHRAVFRVSQSA